MSAFSNNTQDAGQDVQLYPSETILVKEIMAQLMRKYSGRPDTREELMALANEATARFADIGLDVALDLGNSDVAEGGLYTSPVITILGRISKEDIDHERMKDEVSSGLSDGQAFTIDEAGNKKEYSKKLWVPGQG